MPTYKIPSEATSVICYLRGEHGDEVTAWHNGKKIETQPLRVVGVRTGYGDAVFFKPAGASTVDVDHDLRRVVFY